MTKTKEARIEISTLCNYSCVFCPYNNGFNRKKEIMTNQLFFKIIDKLKQQIPQINIITLSGMGEIFIDADILDKIKYCKDNGYIVNLLTNGSFLTKKIINELDIINIDSIRISLHTLNENHYRQITNNKLGDIINIIEYIYKNTNLKLIISSDIININEFDIEELIQTYSKFVHIEIWKPHNWVNWGSYRIGEKKEKTCGRPFNGPLQIQVDGTINMCCFDYNGKLTIGDFKTQTINEIFNSKMYLKIKSFHEGNKKNIICSSCDQLFVKNKSILIYSNKNIEDRINKTSTNYDKISE